MVDDHETFEKRAFKFCRGEQVYQTGSMIFMGTVLGYIQALDDTWRVVVQTSVSIHARKESELESA